MPQNIEIMDTPSRKRLAALGITGGVLGGILGLFESLPVTEIGAAIGVGLIFGVLAYLFVM